MGKHLLDETAEFKMPSLARHAAEENDHLEETQRWDPGFSRKPAVPGPKDAPQR